MTRVADQHETARALAEKFARKCIDCGEPAWDTRAFLCKWCERWRRIDFNAAVVK